jgi:hypothetical protein
MSDLAKQILSKLDDARRIIMSLKNENAWLGGKTDTMFGKKVIS